MLRTVDVHTVFIVQRDEFLRDNGDDATELIIQLKVEAQNIALQLPAESFDISDVFDQMEELNDNSYYNIY